MADLTITVDDDLLRRARARAVEQGTSVNAVLRDELSRYVEASGGDAVTMAATAQLSIFDAAIVAAAQRGGSATLLSEDLNAGQVLQGVRVVNPFA